MGKRVTKSFSLLHEELTLGYYIIKPVLGKKKDRGSKSMSPFLPRIKTPTNLVSEALQSPSIKGSGIPGTEGPAHVRESIFVKNKRPCVERSLW